MAKTVFVCVRNAHDEPEIKRKFEIVIKKLVPDNTSEAPCKVAVNGNTIYVIANYSDVISEHDGSVCM